MLLRDLESLVATCGKGMALMWTLLWGGINGWRRRRGGMLKGARRSGGGRIVREVFIKYIVWSFNAVVPTFY